MTKTSKGLDRREFARLASSSLAVAIPAAAAPTNDASPSSPVVRVHSSKATRPWDYAANAPWDHTVEMTKEQPGKIRERYYDFIDDKTVSLMLRHGLYELTGLSTAAAALKTFMPGFDPGQKFTLKLNMNNASFDPAVTTNRMDQTMPLVNAVLDLLVGRLGVPGANITVLDASRYFHPVIMKGRSRHGGIQWIDSQSPDRWDPSESVKFTRDTPAPGGNFWMPKGYTQADHIFNFCLFKAHGCGVTGAMKSHFGSIPSPKFLHEGMGQKSYIADLCATPSIRNKVRLNIVDALFGNWGGPVWAPRPWLTFSEPSPNSIFLSRDPVALDSVMLDHLAAELKAQGPNAPSHVKEWVETTTFLEYAMRHHGLGVHERKPYNRISYSTVEV